VGSAAGSAEPAPLLVRTDGFRPFGISLPVAGKCLPETDTTTDTAKAATLLGDRHVTIGGDG
jgi:hypothetical protein